MKEIEIIIDPDGKTVIDLKGFKGKGCAELTDELLKALQGKVEKRIQKNEFFKPEPKTKVKQNRL